MYLTSDKTYEALFGGCMFSVVEVRSFWNQYLTSYLEVLGEVEVVKSPY